MNFMILRQQLRSHLTDRTNNHLESGEGVFFFFLFGWLRICGIPGFGAEKKKKKENQQ